MRIITDVSKLMMVFFTTESCYDYEKSRYIYQYQDHLSNVRISFTRSLINGSAEVLSSNDYYPFGLNFINVGGKIAPPQFNPSISFENYKYNGKELEETGMYDYGARFYMPDIGRWGVTDPLAEKNRRWSPYRYANDNPLMFIDPDGMEEAAAAPPPEDTSGGDNPFQSIEILGGVRINSGYSVQYSASYSSPSSQAADSKKSESSNTNSNLSKNLLGKMKDYSVKNPLDGDSGEPDQKTKPQQTKESMLRDRISKIKMHQKISGDELKKYIPDMKGIDFITKISQTKFEIESTWMGSAFVSDGAYLEINLNSKIAGIDDVSGKHISVSGIGVKVVGVSVQKPVGEYKTSNFIIHGNQGSFKVGEKIVSFNIK